MKDYIRQNKEAWEYRTYDFWIRQNGTPSEKADMIRRDPMSALRKHAGYFGNFQGLRIANICGSCGKKAVPMGMLGAKVTVFDISEGNRRYAVELAEAAKVQLDYEVCDVLQIDMQRYGGYFDVVFMEGGILHYFHDLNRFMEIMHSLLKPGGKMICSDFHPFTKIMDSLGLQQPVQGYFCTDVFEGEMAHARFYDEESRKLFPKCSYRKYTVSEIINSVIEAGFSIRRFDEHPSWMDSSLPGEFTVVAEKERQ